MNTTNSKFPRLHLFRALALTAVVCLAGTTTPAQTIEWQGGTADYTNAVDWVGGVVPVSTDNADNSNGTNNVVQINIGDPDWTVTDISAGGNTGAGGAITQYGQNLNVNGWLHDGAGTNSLGLFTLDGGTINVPNGPIFLGEGPGSISVFNMNGGTINHYNGNQVFYVAVGNWNGAETRTGTVNQASGTINENNQVWVGQYGDGQNIGYGTYNFSGGILNVTNYFAIGRSGANGTMNMTGGTFNQGNNGNILVGTGYGTPTGGSSVGVFTQSGGAVTCQGQFLIPEESPATGEYDLSGTGSLTVNNWIAVGRSGGSGVLNLSGGSITKTGDNTTHLSIGSSGTGVLNQTNGTITSLVSDTYLGEGGTGTWNLEGGSAYLGNLFMCLNGTADGILNLDGGLLQVSQISTNSIGYSQLSFNGGTLQANANNANFMVGLTVAQVESGGAVIDSQDYDITIAQNLQDAGGGLTKNGIGTLTLTGANNYSGATTVNAGTLITGSGSSASSSAGVTVADNAGFGVLVQSANGEYATANLTLGSSVGAALDFNLSNFGNPGAAPLNVSSVLTVNGTIAVNIADALPQAGQVPLIQFGSLAGTASFVLASLPVGVSANLVTNGNVIALNITSVNQPYWDGLAGGNWDINNTTNWYNLGTGLPTFYTDGSAVVFDDTATGTTTVNVTTTVSPKSVTINNTNETYTFIGSGSISGATGLTKSGTNTLSLLDVNAYTGPTVINGGKLTVTNLANGGSPSAIGASPASPTNLVLNGTTFDYEGPAVTINRGYDMTASSVITNTGNLTLGGLAQATAGTYVKTGPGTLTYAGTGTNVLSVASGGFSAQVLGGTLVLDGSAGGQTNTVGGDIYVGSGTSGNNVFGPANCILTNTTLNSPTWLALGRGNGTSGYLSTLSLYNSTVTFPSGVSLGYANGLASYSATQIMSLYGTSQVNDGGALNICENQTPASPGPVSSTFNVAGSSSLIAPGVVVVGGNEASGVLNLNSTGTASLGNVSGATFRVGGNAGGSDTGVGVINQSAGTFLSGSNGVYVALGVGGGASCYGALNLSGGIMNRYTGVRLGRGGLASFMQSGGTFNLVSGEFSLSSGSSGNAVASFTGGSATVASGAGFRVPEVSSSATVNIGTEAGGNASVVTLFSSGFQLCYGNTGTGTLNLDSGTLQLGGPISAGTGTSAANFNGGTVQAGVNNINLINTTVTSLNVFKGGLTVDTMANTATVSGRLLVTAGNGIYPAGGTLTVSANGGAGYIGAPLVTVSGGSGSGATAIATVSSGTVTNVILTSPGQNYQAADVLTFTFAGGGYTTAASAFTYTVQAGDVAANAGGGLTKIGTGTLLLTGANTYTGTTVVSVGALGGTGSLAGSATVASGATLMAGTAGAVGTLAINGNLTLSSGSTTFLKVTPSSNDGIQGLSGVTYAGALVITNISGSTLTPGNVYKLFNSAGAGTGNFSSVTILPSGTGTFNPTNGELTIGNSAPPVISGPVVSGGNLILTGTGGTAGNGYTLLSTTNLLAGSWVTNTTGTFQTGGTFSNAIPMVPGVPVEFFQVRTP